LNENWSRNAFVYLLILVAGATLFFNIYQPTEPPEQITLSELARSVKENRVKSIKIREDEVNILVHGSEAPIVTRREPDVSLVDTLTGLGVTSGQLVNVELEYEALSYASNWVALLINLLPLVFIAGLFFVILRQTQGNNNQALSFGKSKARLFTSDKPTITFDDVAGSDEAKHWWGHPAQVKPSWQRLSLAKQVFPSLPSLAQNL